MRLAAPYKYQGRDMLRSTGVFYLVILLLLALSAITLAVGHSGYASMPFDSISCVYLFVLGLCTFKEYFLYFTQNGVSRRSFFVSKLLAMLTFCVGMALVDNLLSLIFSSLFTDTNISFTQLVSLLYPDSGFFDRVLFAASTNLLTFAAGSFITVMFYRLNKVGKLIVGIGVPALLFVGLPIALSYTDLAGSNMLDTLAAATLHFAQWVAVSAWRLYLVQLVFAAVLMAFTWLLERRAIVKGK